MISHFSGDSLVIDVPVVDAAGQAFPLANVGIRYHARAKFYPAAEQITLTLDNGITLLNANTARVSVPAAAIVAVGEWLHSFTLTGAGLGVQTLWADTINVLPV